MWQVVMLVQNSTQPRSQPYCWTHCDLFLGRSSSCLEFVYFSKQSAEVGGVKVVHLSQRSLQHYRINAADITAAIFTTCVRSPDLDHDFDDCSLLMSAVPSRSQASTKSNLRAEAVCAYVRNASHACLVLSSDLTNQW